MKTFLYLLTTTLFLSGINLNCLAKAKIKKVVIAGSYRKYLKEVCSTKALFEEKGIEVLEPSCTEVVNPKSEFIVMLGDINHQKPISDADLKAIEDKFLSSIKESDAVYVINPQGYIGLSTAVEIGFAKGIKKPIFCLEEPNDYSMSVNQLCIVRKPEDIIAK